MAFYIQPRISAAAAVIFTVVTSCYPLFAGGAKETAPDPFASAVTITRNTEYSIDTNKMDSLFILAEEGSISVSSSDKIPVPERLSSKAKYERPEDAFIVKITLKYTGFASTESSASAIVDKASKANPVTKSGSSIIIDASFASSFFNPAAGEKLLCSVSVLVPENLKVQYALKNSAGDITISKLTGGFQIINAKGNVFLDSCTVTKTIQAEGNDTSFSLQRISLKDAESVTISTKIGSIELLSSKESTYDGKTSSKKVNGGYVFTAEGKPAVILTSEKTKKPFKVKL